MDAGRCRRCGRAFTSGEIVGLGILRPRRAERGGPIVEFECPECRALNRLVPHGQGRYAPPGEPPPPPPDEDDRRVPWRRGAATSRTTTPADARPPGERPAVPPPPRAPADAPAQPAEAPPMSAAEAMEALGIPATATRPQIEEAYRALALRLHPDKVAHLDAEFVALAERKFRRVQAARDLLVGD